MHRTVSESEWIEARKELLEQEKAWTRERDRLAEMRRALPWVRVKKDYQFQGADGPVTLGQLFDGRSQLVVYHFMFGPDWEQGCPGCSFLSDHIDGARQHFEHHDVTFVAVSRAPIEKLQAYRKRMGWTFNWVSSAGSDFNFDFHVSFPKESRKNGVFYNFEQQPDPEIDELSGTSVFYKDETGAVFHTYSTYARGGDLLLGTYNFIDLTPKGRDETGPHHDLRDWVRRHDEYDDAKPSKSRHAAE